MFRCLSEEVLRWSSYNLSLLRLNQKTCLQEHTSEGQAYRIEILIVKLRDMKMFLNSDIFKYLKWKGHFYFRAFCLCPCQSISFISRFSLVCTISFSDEVFARLTEFRKYLFPYCLLQDSVPDYRSLWFVLFFVFGLYYLKLPSDWKLKIILILQITNTEEMKLCLHQANARIEMGM